MSQQEFLDVQRADNFTRNLMCALNDAASPDLKKMFSVFKKCQGKLDCLVNKMLLIC